MFVGTTPHLPLGVSALLRDGGFRGSTGPGVLHDLLPQAAAQFRVPPIPQLLGGGLRWRWREAWPPLPVQQGPHHL